MCKAKELSDKLLSMFSEVKQTHDEFVKELSTQDKMTSDILHRIELGTFNACEGYKLCKKIKEVRQERRVIKDELEPLKKLHGTILTIKSKVQKSNKNIVKMEQNMQNRSYTPRVLKEIF